MTPQSHLYNVFTVKVIILKADFFLNELESLHFSSFKTKTNHTRGTKCTVRMRVWIVYQTKKIKIKSQHKSTGLRVEPQARSS